VLIDDGSPAEWLEKLNVPVFLMENDTNPELPKNLDAQVSVFTFKENYGRPCLTIIPGWWRSFTFASILGIRYNIDKLVHIESDTYLISERMVDWIAQTSDVWASPYTWKYWYAETAIQIIPRKKIPTLFQFWALGKEYWYKNGMTNIQYVPELVLPIEYVEKHLVGDRWGEDWYREDIPDNADYVVNMGAITKGAIGYCHDLNDKHTKFFAKKGILDV